MTPDALVARWMPVIPGYVQNNYRWVEDKYGECLYSVSDLIQLSMVKLIQKAREFTPDESATDEANHRMFFSFLKKAVQFAIKQEIHDHKNPHWGDSFDGDNGEETDVRTSLRIFVDPSLIHSMLVDYFDLLPQRAKLCLAIRYFDELTVKEAAAILGDGAQTYTSRVIERYRRHARNLWVEFPERLENTRMLDWETPAAVEEYVRNRWQSDIPGYLAHVSRCLRADVSYLVDMLGSGYTVTPRSTVTPQQQQRIQRIENLSALGWTQRRIAEALGVSQSVVHRALHHRVVA